jgi:membrane protein DedA with SNARE-associated domain
MLSLAIDLVSRLTYFGIFIGTFIEGPAVGLLAGFLIKIGFLNLSWVYIAHVLGDLTADFFYYLIGYKGQKKFLKPFGISEKKLDRAKKIKKLFYKHPKKTIILGKLTHILGLPILLGLGMLRYPWYKFLLFDFLAAIIKSAILIALGYYLAALWTKANNVISYLSWLGVLLIIIAIIYFIILNFKYKFNKYFP